MNTNMAVKEPHPREALRRRRRALGITQKHMARCLGYSRSQPYHDMEKGLTSVKVGAALLIAEILGSTVEELFFEEKYHNKWYENEI